MCDSIDSMQPLRFTGGDSVLACQIQKERDYAAAQLHAATVKQKECAVFLEEMRVCAFHRRLITAQAQMARVTRFLDERATLPANEVCRYTARYAKLKAVLRVIITILVIEEVMLFSLIL